MRKLSLRLLRTTCLRELKCPSIGKIRNLLKCDDKRLILMLRCGERDNREIILANNDHSKTH